MKMNSWLRPFRPFETGRCKRMPLHYTESTGPHSRDTSTAKTAMPKTYQQPKIIPRARIRPGGMDLARRKVRESHYLEGITRLCPVGYARRQQHHSRGQELGKEVRESKSAPTNEGIKTAGIRQGILYLSKGHERALQSSFHRH